MSLIAPASVLGPSSLSLVPITWRVILLATGAGLLLLGFGVLLAPLPLRLVSLTAGVALLMLAGFAILLRAGRYWLLQRDLALLGRLHGNSGTACLICDAQGHVCWANHAARSLFPETVASGCAMLFAAQSASPAARLERLLDLARAKGRTTYRDELDRGSLLIRVEALSEDRFLWQLELLGEATSDDLPVIRFAPDGTLLHIAPCLRREYLDLPPTLSALFSGRPPPPGVLHKVSVSGKQRGALLVPQQGAHTEGSATVLLLPAAPATEPVGAQQRPNTHSDLLDLPIAIAHIDTGGRISFANGEARRLLRLGSGPLPLLCETLEGLGRPVMEWLGDIAAGRPTTSTEVLSLNRPDCESYLKVTLTLSDQNSGEPSHIVAVFSDATELKSLEAKYTQSQKMQAIGQLAGGVAHDFNNLLTAISGHCDLILLRHDRSDLDYPDLMQIQQNTNRAAALVRQLLALSRQQTLKFVTLDLEETMGDVIHLLNRLVGEKITLTLQHGDNVAPIRSDRRQFEQVLMNLVVNARDAMPMGGEIRITTETVALPDGLQRPEVSLPPGDYTCVRVSDDGTGIAPGNLDKVFNPFFTTKRQGEGTGLGLSTVYGIVKQSGGYIFADSEEGVGTTFTLYFAAQEEEVPALPEPRVGFRSLPMLEQRALILLVEDEAPVRSFAARALELQGHRVIEADCGETALEILEDPTIEPDFFVTDVVMPGIDGPGWVAQVRDRFPDTPVLFMSGYAEDSRVAARARINNASFLNKPFSLAEFTSTVADKLRAPNKAA